MATHSSILAGEYPWTEEPGGLWSMGSSRVGHDGATNSTVRYPSEDGNVCSIQLPGFGVVPLDHLLPVL